MNRCLMAQSLVAMNNVVFDLCIVHYAWNTGSMKKKFASSRQTASNQNARVLYLSTYSSIFRVTTVQCSFCV
jgi:hypothetical protein